MRVIVKESFMTSKGNIPTGAIIDIPEKMLDSLREKVEPLFDFHHWQREIEKLSIEMADNDPRQDCWEYVREHHPELWRQLMTAEQQVDIAYGEQNAEKINAVIPRARATFTKLIEAWNNRNHYKQPSFMTA